MATVWLPPHSKLLGSVSVPLLVKKEWVGLPGGPVVKTSPSNPGDVSSVSSQGLRSHMLCGQKSKHKTEAIL